MKTYNVTTGRADLSEYNIITEQVIVAIVDEDAHRGTIKKKPFNFKDYDLSEASIVVNGCMKLNKSEEDKVDMIESLDNHG